MYCFQGYRVFLFLRFCYWTLELFRQCDIFTFLFYYYFICISNIEQLINTSISFIRKQIQTMREIKSANTQIVIIYDISTIKLILF